MAEEGPRKPTSNTDPGAAPSPEAAEPSGGAGQAGERPDAPPGASTGGEHSQASVRRLGEDEDKGSQGFGNE